MKRFQHISGLIVEKRSERDYFYWTLDGETQIPRGIVEIGTDWTEVQGPTLVTMTSGKALEIFLTKLKKISNSANV